MSRQDHKPLERTAAQKPQRFYGVQVLRGLAAMLVLVHHANLFLRMRVPGSFDLNLNGASGVDVFFAISGFVMYTTTAPVLAQGLPRIYWRRFLERRVLRVVPLYYALTVLKLLLVVALPAFALGARPMLWNSVASFLFIPSWNANHVLAPVIPPGWTLNYEMLFYAVLTLLLAWRIPLLRGAACVLLLLSCVSPLLPHRWAASAWANPIELEFLAGMLAGWGAKRLAALPPGLSISAAGFCLLALTLPRWQFDVEASAMRVLLWGVPAAVLLAATVALERDARFDRWRRLLLLGDASYALYLTHTFIVPAVAVVFSHMHLAPQMLTPLYFCVALSLAVVVSVFVHLYLEMPAYRWLSAKRLPWSVHSADTAKNAGAQG